MRSPRGRQQERCLGDRAAALADGELGSDARDGALAHLVNCDVCRDDVAGQRLLKTRLRELPDPVMPAGLFDRLVALSGPGGFDDPSDHLELVTAGVAAPRHRVSLPAAARRGLGRSDRLARARAHLRVRRSLRYAMAGGASVLALGISAVAVGSGPAPTPTVVPQMGSFTAENAGLTGEPALPTASPKASFRQVLVSSAK